MNGIWKENGLPVTPYLVPQDCGVHMETKRLTITRSTVLANEMGEKNPFSISFEAGERPFAFSCLPYTASELENALHQEELPPARRTVVCILGAVRGVGEAMWKKRTGFLRKKRFLMTSGSEVYQPGDEKDGCVWIKERRMKINAGRTEKTSI